MGVGPLDGLQDIRIRRAEVVAVGLAGMDPGDGVVLQSLGEALGDGAVEEETLRNMRNQQILEGAEENVQALGI